MAYKYHSNAQSSSDKAIEKFSEMMISRLEEAKATNWKKGWIGGEGNFGMPQNLNGRNYSGTNSLFLFMDTAINHYAVPVYMTFLQKEKEGLRLKKGSEAMPVIYWDMSIKDANGKKVSMADYKNMSKAEKEQCEVRPFLRSFRVYNINQTNMQEVNKEKYDQIVSRFQSPKLTDTEGMYQNKALDRMFERQEWLCRIQYDKPAEGAFFSPSRDMIVVPQKGQFKIGKTEEDIYKDGMEYYSTALHEMAHSTGTEERLNRNLHNHFGDPKYAKEELVAELSSAMVGNTMGFDRRIEDNNVAYVDSWLKTLHEEPKFIVSVMADVNKASNMILEKVDAQKLTLGETPILGIRQEQHNDHSQENQNSKILTSPKTEKMGEEERQAVKASIYKLPTGSYVVQASINGQDLEQKPIDNKTAVTYLRLSDSSQKETMLSSIVKEKYGDDLRFSKADRQVSTGLKL
jgi:antirestriction protein ArdC